MSNVINSFGQFNLIDTFRTVSSTSTLLATDGSKTIIADTATTTLTLPTISGLFTGWNVTIKNTSTGKVTISSASNIDGTTTFVLYPGYAVNVSTDSSTWHIEDVKQTQFATFTVTLSGAITNNATFNLLRVQDFVLFCFPTAISATSGGSPALITGVSAITSTWWPSSNLYFPVAVNSNTVDQHGSFEITTAGTIRWYANAGLGNFNASTALILRPFGVTYQAV